MSDHLPTPPPSYSSNAASESDLVSQLDNLLAHYLVLLDTYSTLRARLSTEFSSGFLSLAHANRNASSTLGAGRRYGPTEFDSRMKASVGLRTSTRSYTGQGLEQEQGQAETPGSRPSSEEKDVEQDETEEQNKGQQQPVEHDDLLLNPLARPISHISYDATTISHKPQPTHPINWFGLFPPSALRQTQNAFTTSVTSTIPELLTAVSQLRSLEDDIWTVRQAMGLEGYDVPEEYRSGIENDAKQKKAEVLKGDSKEVRLAETKKHEEEAITPKQKTPKSTSKTQKLVSRSGIPEPRSKVLRLD